MNRTLGDRLVQLVEERSAPITLAEVTAPRSATRHGVGRAWFAAAAIVVVGAATVLFTFPFGVDREAPASSSSPVLSPPGLAPPVTPEVPTTTSPAIAVVPTTTSSDGPWSEAPSHPVQGRVLPTIIWTGAEYIVWGGEKPSETVWHNDGAALDVETQTWRTLAPSPLSARSEHVAVWTGTEMIVCCGRIVGEGADAASYNPETDTWTVIATPPVAASFMEGVWTGDEVIVFGGVTELGLGQNVGAAAYNPTTNEWRRLSNAPIPLERSAEAAYGAGSIYVWPSTVEPLQPQTPIEYIIEDDRWELLPAPPAEYAPRSPSIVWTGTELLAWGVGQVTDGDAAGVGLSYDPGQEAWTPLPLAPLEPFNWNEGTVSSQAMVWTGTQVIIWTGLIGTAWDSSTSTVASFDPANSTWSLLAPAPVRTSGLYNIPLIWADGTLVVFGDPVLVYTLK